MHSYLHSQNDILASGGIAKSLSVSIGVPFSENLVEKFYLNYFMQGIKSEADKDKCLIASGHSYQSQETGITLTLNGEIESYTSKNSANEGDLIYLSKPLGTGYLLAAYFDNTNMISSYDFENIINYMKRKNSFFVEKARQLDCQTMTDISGYGLASHLIDICNSSNLSSELTINKNILINTNINLLHIYKSSGYSNNLKSSKEFIEISENHLLKNILYDPQTNGPMLMGIKKENQEKFENFFSDKLYRPILIGKFKKKHEKLIYINEK